VVGCSRRVANEFLQRLYLQGIGREVLLILTIIFYGSRIVLDAFIYLHALISIVADDAIEQ
jgi:hypothetical protein